tara:strand:- start:303 stop:458 length:156 start_codon:yes stop_codon:yes gene_type:complete
MISKQLKQAIEKYNIIQTRASDQEIQAQEDLIKLFCEVEGVDPERAFEECA